MEGLAKADAALLLWLNGWVGRLPWLDAAAQWLASDYLAPVLLSLSLVGAWFAPRHPPRREAHQRGVMASVMGMGFANLAVLTLNHFFFRPRPFTHYELQLLFYRPTDSSFPANPAAVGFALAVGMLGANRRLSVGMMLLAGLWCLARLYAGVFYPSDIVGGALIGAAAAGLAHLFIASLEPVPTLLLRLARAFYLA